VIFFERSPFATAVVTSAMFRTWAVRLDRHLVYRVGQILPCSTNALHFRLATQLSFRTYLKRHTGYLGGEGVQLIHHRVDGLFQFKDLTLPRLP
jgi:hypothetical protein